MDQIVEQMITGSAVAALLAAGIWLVGTVFGFALGRLFWKPRRPTHWIEARYGHRR